MSTRVGYAGGTRVNPAYHSLGDHSETVRIEYDPAQISYGELLDVFWASHNPVYEAPSRQYMSIVLYHDDEQRRLAVEARKREQAETGRKVFTEIVPAGEFYLAEDYHQKFFLRHVPEILKELIDIYPRIDDFVASTAVARINGYVAGYGVQENLKEELDSLGLTPRGRARLVEIASSRLGAATCRLKEPSRG